MSNESNQQDTIESSDEAKQTGLRHQFAAAKYKGQPAVEGLRAQVTAEHYAAYGKLSKSTK